MTMIVKDRFKAALEMIQVTPENYKKLNTDVILHVCKVVAEAEEQNLREEASALGDSYEPIDL